MFSELPEDEEKLFHPTEHSEIEIIKSKSVLEKLFM
jgi:hypothetical protein